MLMMGIDGWSIPASTGPWTGPTSGLVSRWPMDNANVSGTTITDVVSGINGTASGTGITAATGPSGGAGLARAFDGASYITLSSVPISNFTTGNSVFLWVKVTDITGGGAGAERFLNFNTDISNYAELMLDEGKPGGFNVEYNSAATLLGRSTTAQQLTNNTFAHVGYTCDGASNVILYVNGSSVAVSAPTGASSFAGASYFGVRNPTVVPLTGSIAQAVVYNRVLSSGEVTTLFNAF